MTLVVSSKIFLGKYRVAPDAIGSVGESGDRSSTFEAEEIGSGKKVRMELVPIGSLEPNIREQLEARAIAAKKLNHLNIQSLYDFGVQAESFVYIREQLEGTRLSEWVKTHGPMPVGPVLRIAAQVVSALGAAGFHRLNHHAINPANVMLVPGQTAEGQWPLVKVLHFESGAFELSKQGATGTAVENWISYISPEQLRYGMIDFRSEVYSLGATIWFLLTGVPPVLSADGVIDLTFPKPSGTGESVKAIPEKTRQVLAKMLSVNPTGRPRDPLPFYTQLQECLADMGPKETTPRRLTPSTVVSPAPRSSPSVRRGPVKAVAFSVVPLMAVLVAILFYGEYFRPRRPVLTKQPVARTTTSPLNLGESSPPPSSGEPIVMLAHEKSQTKEQSSAPAVAVDLIRYEPMVGMPGGKDFKIATLTFRIEANSPVQISEVSFYVDSAPFNEGSTLKLPITLLVHTGIFLGPPGTIVDPTHSIERTVWLKSQENLFPNWQVAYHQTENATFRWTLGHQRAGGSAIKPLQKAWSRSAPEVRRAEPVKEE